jgi:MerR family transcriptional regulator/heat shock protein HspR
VPRREDVPDDAPVFVISVAAQLAGMHAQTLRQYDRLGLVTPGRTGGGGRRYSARDVALLREVQRLSQEGVSLAGIQRILELEAHVDALQARGTELTEALDQARTAYDAAKARLDALNKQVDAQRAAVALARANAEQVAERRSGVEASRHMQEAADAQRAKADVRLRYTEIHAPIGGIVDTRAVRQGEYVTPGQPIVTLINPDDLWIRADVEATLIDKVRIGDVLTVRLPSGAERKGTVFYRAADAGFATQRDVSRTKRDIKTFEVRLRADNSDRRLAVGMTAYVVLPLK